MNAKEAAKITNMNAEEARRISLGSMNEKKREEEISRKNRIVVEFSKIKKTLMTRTLKQIEKAAIKGSLSINLSFRELTGDLIEGRLMEEFLKEKLFEPFLDLYSMELWRMGYRVEHWLDRYWQIVQDVGFKISWNTTETKKM